MNKVGAAPYLHPRPYAVPAATDHPPSVQATTARPLDPLDDGARGTQGGVADGLEGGCADRGSAHAPAAPQQRHPLSSLLHGDLDPAQPGHRSVMIVGLDPSLQ